MSIENHLPLQVYLEYARFPTFALTTQTTYNSIKDLKTYLQQNDKSYQNIFQSHPVEAVYNGKILNEWDRVPGKTTSKNPIQFYLKFIREPRQKPTEEYFKQRGWDFYSMIYDNNGLNSILKSFQDKKYSHNHQELKQEISKYSERSESFQNTLLTKIITSAFYSTEGFQIEQNFEIDVGIHPPIKADYVLYDEARNPALIITQAKEGNMSEAVIENLDQLKRYSMTRNEQKNYIFFGLVTNQEKWIFTAYVKPIENEADREKNFMISNEYSLQLLRKKSHVVVLGANRGREIIDVLAVEPEEKSTERIIQLIRGFILRANKGGILDRVVLQSKKSIKDIMEYQRRHQHEDGFAVSASIADFGFLWTGERDRLLQKFKQGEVLMDVFAESGILGVRAAKLGMKVFANEMRAESNYFIEGNVKDNDVKDAVKYYGQETRKFIRKIIQKEKVNHICMFQPNNSVQYLSELTQAFLQKSKVVYSAEELPWVYVYGICDKEDLLWKKNKIVREVQDSLKRGMKKDLEGEIVCVTKTGDYQVYCLEFRLPYEIVNPDESGDEMEELEDFEIYQKKIHI